MVLGARRGEFCGLKWRDVDLDNGEVFIASGVVRVAGRPLIDKDTKTHAKRRVAIGADTAELIKSYRLRQVQAALAVGASLAPDAYVFSQKADGSKPASPDGVTHRFQQLAARLGVRALLHDLRHFMVTELVAGGVDWRTVSGRAAHADGHMTLGTYAHFQQAQDRQAAEFMDGCYLQPHLAADGRWPIASRSWKATSQERRMFELTDQAFTRVQPLLAADSRRGRPCRDHRQVLGGILWKLHTAGRGAMCPNGSGPGRPAMAGCAAGRLMGPG